MPFLLLNSRLHSQDSVLATKTTQKKPLMLLILLQIRNAYLVNFQGLKCHRHYYAMAPLKFPHFIDHQSDLFHHTHVASSRQLAGYATS